MNHTIESATNRFGFAAPVGRRRGGFTLTEMLTTLAVLVVLFTIAAASFNSTVKSNRLFSAQSEMAAALALARSEAGRRGVPVMLAATASVIGNEFGGGWTVFADLNGNDAFDTGEPELRTHEAIPADIVVKTGATSSITYAPNGFLVPPSAVTVRICRKIATGDTVPEYELTVQPNGMTDVSAITCP